MMYVGIVTVVSRSLSTCTKSGGSKINKLCKDRFIFGSKRVNAYNFKKDKMNVGVGYYEQK